MHILLLNLRTESTQALQQVLSVQGYDIAAACSLTVDDILTRSPELLITEATPSNLSCRGLISQIKASSHLQALKIVMIVHGDALERARRLDLGAVPTKKSALIETVELATTKFVGCPEPCLPFLSPCFSP